VSEGATRSRLGALRRWRYVVIDHDHVVRLAAAGRRARAVWEPLGEDATRVRDLPRLAGVSKEGLAMLVGFLARAGLATVAPDPAAPRGQTVSLMPKGLAARRASGRLLVNIEERWRRRFGAGAIDELRAALNGILDARAGDAPLLARGLVPPPGGWRARRPYLTQTQAVLRDPRAALPRYPRVLHRGGFPDGS
jgi:DNA-binding MarR family transcriptional regulator